MLQKLRGNNQGFTLIELMIVIAIIGILAAIAIPNFISYRNKSFCSAAESDANAVSGGLGDYFAIPKHKTTPPATTVSVYSLAREGKTDARIGMTGLNKLSITNLNSDPNNDIWITVLDGTGRCPVDYRLAQDVVANPTGYWDTGATDTEFHLLMR